MVLALLLVVAALAGWGYLAVEIARERVPLDGVTPRVPVAEPADLAALELRRGEIELETADLEARLRDLGEDREAQRQAVREVQERLRLLQSENAQLRAQVAFLSQLFGGDDGPIEIGDLVLSADDEDRVRYWFKVSRTDAGDAMLTGEVRLQVRGQLQGEEHYLDLVALSEGGRDGHRLGFRNFQEIDGTIQLPEDFEPEALLVVVVPDDKATGGAQRQFEWRLGQTSD